MTENLQIDIPDTFGFLLQNSNKRNFVIHGGRGSGKSTSIAIALIIRALSSKLRILCTREIQNTIKDSVHKLLKDLITKYKLDNYFTITKESIRTVNGSEFIFKGLHRNATEIKSMEGIDICWVEEAQAISDNSLDLLIPTIRKDGSQIWYSFNRVTEFDPVYERFCVNPRKDTIVKQVNYDKNPFFPKVLLDELEYDKENNYDKYLHIWEGEPLQQGDNCVLSRSQIIQAMDREVSDEGAVEIGADIARYGDDRIVFFKRKGLKAIDYKIYKKLSIVETADRLMAFAENDKTILIKVDDTGVGSGVTDILKSNGFNVKGINFGSNAKKKNKYYNCISEMWFEFSKMVSDVSLPNLQELKTELTTRQYKLDNKGRWQIEGKDKYKERGYKSPDIADALLLCYYNKQPSTLTVEIW